MHWLRTIGHPFSQLLYDGIGTPAVHTAASYHAPIRVDDLLELELRVVAVGNTSYTLECGALQLPELRLAVAVRVVYVFAMSERLPPYRVRAEPLPAWLPSALATRG
jgi:acyl-CoA thioesterase FadM